MYSKRIYLSLRCVVTYCVLFNQVNSDGVGDFSHFEDILNFMLASDLLKHMRFFAIVCFNKEGASSNYAAIEKKLEKLGVDYLFGYSADHWRFSEDDEVIQTLNQAEQAIIVSFDGGRTSLFNQYERHLKQSLPIKFIGEHEVIRPFSLGDISINCLSRSLGLSNSCYGIKIAKYNSLSPSLAWAVINSQDSNFANRLLTLSDVAVFDDMMKQQVLIPAYFNVIKDFYRFLRFLGVNDSFAHDQTLMIHLSGLKEMGDFISLFSYYIKIDTQLNSCCIREIIVSHAKHEMSHSIIMNPLGKKKAYIVMGYYLTDASLNALYQLSSIAGVSGDNTFERCVALNVLPLYRSTNVEIKAPTLIALKKITQLPELDISPKARLSFEALFTFNSYEEEAHQDAWGQIDSVSMIDFNEMIAAWPVITAYLKTFKNFYNRLEDIVLEHTEKKYNKKMTLFNQVANKDEAFFLPQAEQGMKR